MMYNMTGFVITYQDLLSIELWTLMVSQIAGRRMALAGSRIVEQYSAVQFC